MSEAKEIVLTGIAILGWLVAAAGIGMAGITHVHNRLLKDILELHKEADER